MLLVFAYNYLVPRALYYLIGLYPPAPRDLLCMCIIGIGTLEIASKQVDLFNIKLAKSTLIYELA